MGELFERDQRWGDVIHTHIVIVDEEETERRKEIEWRKMPIIMVN